MTLELSQMSVVKTGNMVLDCTLEVQGRRPCSRLSIEEYQNMTNINESLTYAACYLQCTTWSSHERHDRCLHAEVYIYQPKWVKDPT